MGYKFFFCSPVIGCETNSHLGTKVIKFFKRNDWSLVTKSRLADYIIINTCGVVDSTEKQSLRLIEFYLDRYRDSKEIIVCGCLTKINKNLENIYKSVRIIKDLKEFNELVDYRGDIDKIEINDFKKGLYENKEFNFDDYFIIETSSGCLGNCSYCSVKFAKGTLKSKPLNQVLSEFKNGVNKGYDKFFFIGDDCGCYGQDIGTDLVCLLKETSKIKDNCKIAFNYIEPNWLIKYYPGLKVFFENNRVNYIRVPLQSGSNRIIGLMNRKYNVKDALKIIDEIKLVSPDTVLDTMLLIGFPTETGDDFLLSVEASKHFDKVTFGIYSERPNTASVKIFPKVTEEQLKKQADIVRDIIMKESKSISLNLSEYWGRL